MNIINRLRDEKFYTEHYDILFNDAADEIEKLQNMLFVRGAMEDAPCFCCGYNGAGYFQPEQHKCAAMHNKLRVLP